MSKRTRIEDIPEKSDQGQEEVSDEQLELVVGGLPPSPSGTVCNTCTPTGYDDD